MAANGSGNRRMFGLFWMVDAHQNGRADRQAQQRTDAGWKPNGLRGGRRFSDIVGVARGQGYGWG